MRKPALLYYEILDFQTDNIRYMNEHFDLSIIEDPTQDKDKMLEKAEVCFAPMGFTFDKKKIEKCKMLQVIATPTTGIFHIDKDFAEKQNIAICSLKNQQAFLSTITPTAELAWGLILCVTRYIPWAHESVCKGKWEGRRFSRQTPKMLSKMSLGIIGLGRLGTLVAGYGDSFGMQVFYYDPYIKESRFTKCHNLEELAKTCEIVSVHTHLSKETENLVDQSFMEAMPRGSYIINTARGGIVDENALLELLHSGHIAGAGLDMLAGEHLPGFQEKLKEHPLVKYANNHENLVLTPKMGGGTVDAWQKTERKIIDLIIYELKNRETK